MFVYFLLFIHYYLYPQMTNPFQFFNQSDDEEDTKANVVKGEKADDKHKRTHQEKRIYKKQLEDGTKKVEQAPRKTGINESAPQKTKESHIYQHMQRPKKEWKAKELTQGHVHDRQSGTGARDRPRKAGGGYGNVGNVKDEQNADKYAKEGEEAKPTQSTDKTTEEHPPVEEKAPEPEKLTLEEYYKAKGVDLTYNAQAKAPVKKSDINAEWIKKEKLVVIQSKEDLKNLQRNNVQAVTQTAAKVGLDIDEADLSKLGFGAKTAPKQHTHHKHEEQKGGDRKGVRKNKPQFSAEDFPTL